MHTIHIKELFENSKKYYNKSITICGWVRSIRNSKNFGFIVINDGTFLSLSKSSMIHLWTTWSRSAISMLVPH